MKRILGYILIAILLGGLAYGIFWPVQDIKEREHLEHRANVTEAKTAYIQEVMGFWDYHTSRTVGSWWVVEAQQDVNKFNEAIEILGG